jgi:hypothetical protein
MENKFSKTEKFLMRNPVFQFIRYIVLSIKILFIVAGGHGGTRKE